jgi:hypothetical protein
MKPLRTTLAAWLLLCVSVSAFGANLKAVYVDNANNVHIIDSDHKDTQVTTTGNILDVEKSADGLTVAWRVADDSAPDGSTARIADRGSHQVVIYRNGKARSIECKPFIRDYWFWRRGTYLGIDCGGLHFAGREILYDTTTLKQIDSLDQAVIQSKDRPEWSDSSPHFSGD